MRRLFAYQSMRRKGEQRILTVNDTGCGMSEETLTHVFDRFYQGDASHFTAGNGLGLALVKRIFTLTHGKSRVGAGTTFTLKLKI